MKKDNQYRLAPVFDNSTCLFPQLIDEDEMKQVIMSEEETDKFVYRFPTSQIKLNDKKSSYYDVIHSLSFVKFNDALLAVFPRIDMKKVYRLVDETIFISDTHKEFYKHMLEARYEKILKSSYDALTNKE